MLVWLILCLARSAQAQMTTRAVSTFGLGLGGAGRTECGYECTGNRLTDVFGVAGLFAAGLEWGDRVAGARVEGQVSPIVGNGWALVAGPMATLRVIFLECGIGLAAVALDDDQLTLDPLTLAIRFGVGWPVSTRWTLHASGDAAVGRDAVAGVLVVSVSRKR
jgi:hypothetical protein